MPPDSRASERLRALADEIEWEARRAPFDVCKETYARAGRDPAVPIVSVGSLNARFCAVGRELGRDEVLIGEPLVGISGRRMRRAAHESLFDTPPTDEMRFASVLDHVLLTNVVPYRPVNNKAYDKRTTERFRPFVERFLADHWTGDRVIALGRKSFLWFAPYAAGRVVADTWADADTRFDRSLDIVIRDRAMSLVVVPHPSPLSPFKRDFPELLRRQLQE